MAESLSPKMIPFKWPAGYPETEEQFEALMWAIDTHFCKEEMEVFQRPRNVSSLVVDAFGWTGHIFPNDELADFPGYKGDILMAKAHRWYKIVYGDRLIAHWTVGYVPAIIGNALWKVRVPMALGACRYVADRHLSNQGRNGFGEAWSMGSIVIGAAEPAEINVFCLVEGLSQGMATRLRDDVISEFIQFCSVAMAALPWFAGLFWLVQHPDKGLFYEAFKDYAASTDSLLNRRYSQSRWDSSQAIEKMMKGLLNVAKEKVPDKGRKGHDLVGLGKLLQNNLSIAVDEVQLQAGMWPPCGRYAEIATTQDECLRANHAVLRIAEQLSKAEKVAKLLETVRTS